MCREMVVRDVSEEEIVPALVQVERLGAMVLPGLQKNTVVWTCWQKKRSKQKQTKQGDLSRIS